MTSFVDVPEGEEKALLSAIAMQPISVAIQANQFVFQFYKKGVITDDSCGSRGSIDHGVLAVGYGTDLDTQEPYFLVKNSWGATWGEDGYVKLGRGSKNQWGMWYVSCFCWYQSMYMSPTHTDLLIFCFNAIVPSSRWLRSLSLMCKSLAQIIMPTVKLV